MTDRLDSQLVEPFGWLLAVDAYGCKVDRLTTAKHIVAFVTYLCDDVLRMRRFGEPILSWFGASSPKTEGYSVVQLIETSSVVGHFSGYRQSAHIDIFSCAPYDPEAVKAACSAWFAADALEAHYVVRR